MPPDNCGIEKKRLEIASESRRRRPSPTPFRELRRSVCKSPTSDNSIARFAATRQPAFPIGTELPLDYMLGIMRDPFIAREPNTMSVCRPSELFAFQVLM